jgi:hypothetical protein
MKGFHTNSWYPPNECWLEIPKHFPNTILHELIIIPNHVHGITELVKNDVDMVLNDVNKSGVQNFETLNHSINKFRKIILLFNVSIVWDIKLVSQNGLEPRRKMNLNGNEIITKSSSGPKNLINVFANT